MRMLKLINNYNPGDKDNETYDDGKDQNTGNNNQSNTGKLANGKDATVANVQAILDDLRRQYPEGTPWGPVGTANNHSYNGGSGSVDVKALLSGSLSTNTQYGCGGWVAMVSDTIFGKSGAPARQVTKTSDLRPGDIIVVMSTKTNKLSHVAIYQGPNPYSTSGGILTCDGNTSATVSWDGARSSIETSNAHNYYLAYTRYPN